MASGPRQADVEQAPLLGHFGGLLRLADRQLPLLDPGDEDGVELEPFRTVQREEMHPAPLAAGRAEASLELSDELGRRPGAVVEVHRQADESRQVGLTHQLTLAELLR